MLSEQIKERFQLKLKNAMDYAINVCLLGSHNKIKDIRKSNAWSLRQKYRYNATGRYLRLSDGQFVEKDDSWTNVKRDPATGKLIYDIKQWYYHYDKTDNINQAEIRLELVNDSFNPLMDPQFKLDFQHVNLLVCSLLTLAMRAGNCGARSELVAKYLWEHPEGIKRIEAITMATFDHEFIVVNRSGDLKKPETWGDAWIIDAWYGKKGLIFHASEFKENLQRIKKFAQNQVKALEKLNMEFQTYKDHENDIDKCQWEIKPERDRYPSYASRLFVEDYYIVKNIYPTLLNQKDSICSIIKKDVENHQKKFSASLEKIKNRSALKGVNFFPHEEKNAKNFKGKDIISQAITGLNSVVKESLSKRKTQDYLIDPEKSIKKKKTNNSLCP